MGIIIRNFTPKTGKYFIEIFYRSRIKFNHFGNSNYASKEVGEAMRTLEKVMLLRLIYPSTNTAIPIALGANTLTEIIEKPKICSGLIPLQA